MDRLIIRAGYRSWAKRIFELTNRNPGNHAGNGVGLRYYDVENPEQLDRLAGTVAGNADLALFYGWSWMVPEALIKRIPSFCLHPSPLPRYRGGSPLQHQIMAGEYWSAVTIFQMTERMDAGPIFAQVPITLDGSLADVLGRIVQVSLTPTRELINWIAHKPGDGGVPRQLHLTEQNEAEATTYPRRKPADSEITTAELESMTARQLSDKVRALSHPEYPPAFVRSVDGTPVYLWRAGTEPQ